MRLIFILLLIWLFGAGCEKTTEEPKTADTKPETLPPSAHKRVKSIAMYDTLGSARIISKSTFDYSLETGRLSKEVITYTNNLEKSTTTRTYSYTSFAKVDAYTEVVKSSAPTYSNIIRFVYDSLNMPKSELTINLPGRQTYVTAVYTRTNNLIDRTANPDDAKYTDYYYSKGDLLYTSVSYKFNYYNVTSVQYTYDASLLDKSKLFFVETAPLNAECKLLKSEYYPFTLVNTTPKTVTYTYTFDTEGYPTSYQNSEGKKWVLTYY